MVVKVHGGVITDQTLAGSLRYFEIAKTGIGDGAIADGNQQVISASVVDEGSSYAEGNVLTVSGGTGTAAQLTIPTDGGRWVGASGEVLAVQVTTAGDYSALPTNPVSVTGGGGTLATFNLSYTSFWIIPGADGTTGDGSEYYVTPNAPIPGSAADLALSVVSQKANIVQVAIVNDNLIQFAVENTGYGWSSIDGSGTVDDDMLDAIVALGVVTVPDLTATGNTTFTFASGVVLDELSLTDGINNP